MNRILQGLIVIGILSVIWLPSAGFAADGTEITEDEHKAEQMDQLSNEVFEAVKSENYELAVRSLTQLAQLATEVEYESFTNVEGMEAFSSAIVNAKHTLQAIRINSEQAMVKAATVRLAADALVHKNQPLWLTYYAAIKNDLDQINNALKRIDLKAAQQASEQLHTHYSIIRPAVIISRTEDVAVRMDSVLAFIKLQVSNEANFQRNLESGLGPLKLTVEDLFFKDKSTLGPIPGVNVPRTLIIGLTSVIITVLSFVAWKKFQAGRKPIF